MSLDLFPQLLDSVTFFFLTYGIIQRPKYSLSEVIRDLAVLQLHVSVEYNTIVVEAANTALGVRRVLY